jgi:ribosomal protein S6--L-glutamate ligase
VEHIREMGDGNVRFDVRLHRKHVERRVTVEAPIARRARVRSSSGLTQWRIFVRCRIHIGPVQRDIEISLVDRAKMIFRMLLGRSALAHGILIDPGKRYLLSQKRSSPRSARRELKKA